MTDEQIAQMVADSDIALRWAYDSGEADKASARLLHHVRALVAEVQRLRAESERANEQNQRLREHAERAIRDVMADRHHFSNGYMTSEQHEAYVAAALEAAEQGDET